MRPHPDGRRVDLHFVVTNRCQKPAPANPGGGSDKGRGGERGGVGRMGRGGEDGEERERKEGRDGKDGVDRWKGK